MDQAALVKALRKDVGKAAVLDDIASRLVYSRDASHLRLGRPVCVVLPASADEVAAVIGTCARFEAPFVVRGGGTGLSGGALPRDGAVVIGTSRLADIGPVDAVRRRVVCGPGVINEAVSRHAAPLGLRFAPDPSSQYAATVGGNVAANAGGPHCLKVGVTAQHVRRLEWVDVQGRRWNTGRGAGDERGIGLTGLLCGSEGTLGVVTAADLDLTPAPEATVTLLAEFPRLADATSAVVALMGSGVVPEACEIVDRMMLRAVEEAFRFGFATDVDAVMICEVSGTAGAAVEDAERAEEILRASGARAVAAAADEAERTRLWMCRKKAFGAVGRLAPAYISMDVVVPLGQLTPLVEDIAQVRRQYDVDVATAFHAGDGNLHPGVHYDDRDPDLTARAHRASDAIVMKAIARGGSCTGEHGVGLEKRHIVHHQLDPVSLDLMRGIKRICDPENRCNPGKKLPDEGVQAPPPPPAPPAVTFDWESLTVTAPAATPLATLQAEALARGFWIPVGAASRTRASGPGLGGAVTVGDLLDAGTPGPALLGDLRVADCVLQMWAETGDGRLLRAGAPVLKNVAGYDLVRLLVGSGGVLARPLAATFLLKPAPEAVGRWTWPDAPHVFSGESRRDLMQVLRRHGQPTLSLRERTGEDPSLVIMASGRDRDWDLERLGDDLLAWSEDHGIGRPLSMRHRRADLAMPAVLAELPAWAVGSPDWTRLTLRDARPEWPRPRRFLWLTGPDVMWVPAMPAEEPVGWFADTVYRDGVLCPLPHPAADVPLHLLAGLKRLFDPDGALPTPRWLAEVSA
jgi:glycolate oxidase subunit GlcD